MEILFWGSILLIFHAYFGYPLSLWALSAFRKRPVRKRPFTPSLTLIVAAFNEGKRIREKLENTLAVDYPRDRLQVVIASDGSTDATHAIVQEYADRGIELLALPERRGKEAAQRAAVARAQGEIIVFSDTATRLDPGGLREIAANFSDPSVGCVSSVDRVLGADGRPCGEGFYVRYEMWLRSLESRVNSLVGLSGSFFAARRELSQDLSTDMDSDFRTVLNSMKLGLRGVSDPDAIGYYRDVPDSQQEFHRKVRTVLRGQTVFFRNLEFLNVFRYGLFSYQYFCHKLLRWLVPLFLVAALVTNLILAFQSAFYALMLLAQMGFYGIALATWSGLVRSDSGSIRIPLYFVMVNIGIAVAWWRYVSGNRITTWAPSRR